MNIAIRDTSDLAFIVIRECFGFVMAFCYHLYCHLGFLFAFDTIERAFLESVCGFITVSVSFSVDFLRTMLDSRAAD